MAIRTVVTSGFGNGTFNGSVSLLPTIGFSINENAAAIRASVIGIHYQSRVSPSPNAAKDQAWRQVAGYGYYGILSVYPVNPERGDSFTGSRIACFDSDRVVKFGGSRVTNHDGD